MRAEMSFMVPNIANVSVFSFGASPELTHSYYDYTASSPNLSDLEHCITAIESINPEKSN
jgi:hypothetical protein